MTYNVANTANTNTFDFWRNRTNELATAMSNVVVTVDSNAAIGNAAVNGYYSSYGLKMGNATVNVVISAPNSTQISNGGYYLSSNGTWTDIDTLSSVASGNATTSGTSAQNVDSYEMSSYNGVEYSVSIKNNASNDRSIAKIMTTHDGTTAYSTEFGVINTGSALATWAVTTNTTHVVLQVTPTVAAATVRFTRTNL